MLTRIWSPAVFCSVLAAAHPIGAVPLTEAQAIARAAEYCQAVGVPVKGPATGEYKAARIAGGLPEIWNELG